MVGIAMFIMLIEYIGMALLLALPFYIPTFIINKHTKKYFKEEGSFNTVLFLNLTIMFINIFLIWLFYISNLITPYTDFYEEFFTAISNDPSNLKQYFPIVVLIILEIKPIQNYIKLYNHKKDDTKYQNICKYSMIVLVCSTLILFGYLIVYKIRSSFNHIAVTEENTYTYSDFKQKLEERNLVSLRHCYQLPEVEAEDYKSTYRFREGTNFSSSYFISTETTQKFPLFVYDNYYSLIEKKDFKDYEKNCIGNNDKVIEWNIYYVMGELYAATSYNNLIVSESDTITVYNHRSNYYIKDGKILSISSCNQQKCSFPQISETCQNRCYKIKVVDRVDASTLDKIAKEIYKN